MHCIRLGSGGHAGRVPTTCRVRRFGPFAPVKNHHNDYRDSDVFTMNDRLAVEPDSISMFATTSVPAVTRIEVGFWMRSEQHGKIPTVSTSRSGRVPLATDRASTVNVPSLGARILTLRHTQSGPRP